MPDFKRDRLESLQLAMIGGMVAGPLAIALGSLAIVALVLQVL